MPAGQLAGVLASPGSQRGASLGVTAYERTSGDVDSSAAGVAELRFGPPPANHMWLLESVIVHVANAPGSSCSVFVGAATTINLVAGTTKGDLDTADQSPAIYVPGGQSVIVRWADAGAGNTCTASIQYQVARIE